MSLRVLQNRRKGIIGLFLWVIILLISLLIYTLLKGDLTSAVGLSGGLAGVISGAIAFETLYDIRATKLPSLAIYADHTSRYSLFQVVIKNIGGAAAYDIQLEWLESDPNIKNGKVYEIPKNCYGHICGFSSAGKFRPIRALGNGDKHYLVMNSYFNLYKEYTEGKAEFLAKITYVDKPKGGTKSVEIAVLSFEEYRVSLDYVTEETKTLYKLQEIPSLLKRISEKL